MSQTEAGIERQRPLGILPGKSLDLSYERTQARFITDVQLRLYIRVSPSPTSQRSSPLLPGISASTARGNPCSWMELQLRKKLLAVRKILLFNLSCERVQVRLCSHRK